jgi:hypothetical protein
MVVCECLVVPGSAAVKSRGGEEAAAGSQCHDEDATWSDRLGLPQGSRRKVHVAPQSLALESALVWIWPIS